MTRYKRPIKPQTKAELEQELSGICSTKCFVIMVGEEDMEEVEVDYEFYKQFQNPNQNK
jgi:hypothetical protein